MSCIENPPGTACPALACSALATVSVLASRRSQKGWQAVPVVPAAKVVRVDLRNTVTLTAEFEPFYEVDVMAKEAGYIRHMLVDIGDRVQQGQLLATLEIPELQADLVKAKSDVQTASAERAVARGDLQRAQAGAQIAQLSYNRIQDVSKKEPGLVPLQEVDVAHSHNLEADAQVSAAQQRVQAAESRYQSAVAGLAHETALVEYTRIVAPFRGVVTQRYASEGSMIQAGIASQTQAMPVVKVSQNDLLRLMLPVPEENVSLHPQRPTRNRGCPRIEPHFRWHGNPLCRSSANVDANDDRGSRCQKSATDPDSRDVRPGDAGNGGRQERKCCSTRRRGRHGR